ncbi:hypothetical protein ACLOJK_036667, partial [Asimina triloba]
HANPIRAALPFPIHPTPSSVRWPHSEPRSRPNQSHDRAASVAHSPESNGISSKQQGQQTHLQQRLNLMPTISSARPPEQVAHPISGLSISMAPCRSVVHCSINHLASSGTHLLHSSKTPNRRSTVQRLNPNHPGHHERITDSRRTSKNPATQPIADPEAEQQQLGLKPNYSSGRPVLLVLCSAAHLENHQAAPLDPSTISSKGVLNSVRPKSILIRSNTPAMVGHDRPTPPRVIPMANRQPQIER